MAVMSESDLVSGMQFLYLNILYNFDEPKSYLI